jgi:hypothetical protein
MAAQKNRRQRPGEEVAPSLTQPPKQKRAALLPLAGDELLAICNDVESSGLPTEIACNKHGIDPARLQRSINVVQSLDPECTDQDRKVVREVKAADARYVESVLQRVAGRAAQGIALAVTDSLQVYPAPAGLEEPA